MVGRVGYVNIARAIHGDGLRQIKLSTTADAIVGAVIARRAREGGHDRTRRDLADRAVPIISNIEIAAVIQSQASRLIKEGVSSRAI